VTNPSTVELARQRVRIRSGPGASGHAQITGQLADRPENATGYGNVVTVLGAEGEHAVCLTGPLETLAVSEHQRTVDPYGADFVDEKLQ